MTRVVTAVCVGAGNRGLDVYGEFALRNPDLLRFLAVAEPNTNRRKKFVNQHRIPENNSFDSWVSLFQEKKFAQTAIIATPDKFHFEPTLAALDMGYDVLLEKPMATTIEECKLLVKKAEQLEKRLQICHVLRYTPFFSQIHQIVQSGRIGQVVNISLRENVSYFHYAHSFIRGNWHNREKSSPMILAKCCHDLDILYWLVGAKPVKISSFGSLTHFGPIKVSEGVPDRCTDGCPISETCLYFAPRIYIDIIPLLRIARKGGTRLTRLITNLALTHPKSVNRLSKIIPPLRQVREYHGWPVNVITEDFSIEGRLNALQEGPYGKCVYKVDDHDVVDHQVVNIEFENECTASLIMHGHSYEEGRTIRIDGTKGTVKGQFLLSGDYLVLHDSLSGKKEVLVQTGRTDSNHGGGDDGLMHAFVKLISGQKGREPLTSARASLESHLMAFAADKARLENQIVNMNEIR
ncbi:MAG: Gfo/Idh/MocA family protein [Promethearchaeota archaeon]